MMICLREVFVDWVEAIVLMIVKINYIIDCMSNSSLVHEMKGSQFPFGVLNVSQAQANKTLIKKRYVMKDSEDGDELFEKMSKLKGISHKNAINLRSAVEEINFIDLFYQYVPYSIEDSFSENPNLTVKQLHRQFIQLAIFLAKHCITTSFNPNRCGMVLKEGQTLLKYYLPLHQITLTNNRTTLQRFVQIFNVQSMQYLDYLVNQGLNTTFNQSCSQRTFKNRVKLFPHNDKKDKLRKESQPISNLKGRDRRLSNNPHNLQRRKLSSLSKQLSEISQIHKQHKASTRSGGSFNTFQSIISLKSQIESNIRERSEKAQMQCSSNSNPALKRCLSDTTLQPRVIVEDLISRSKRAIESLRQIKEHIRTYQNLYKLIQRIHQY